MNRSAPHMIAFSGPLGWTALVLRGNVLLQLAFGHSVRRDALAALDTALLAEAEEARGRANSGFDREIMDRLLAYAAGKPVDFGDVAVDLDRLSPFRRRVVERCRAIPYGATVTYGALAAEIGEQGAARAVGACMAANRVPLVVPCHRVVAADSRLGGFSAPGGCATKQRLLAMEAASAPRRA